ncbi:MAG TPA: DNA translocase FtsK 4TM domain-containing protein [Candidatus Binataceae bacterium]|nr:DNA translocase FtsK 4TM domain-containing protein [Candidatus Binataceae bacterium]
MAKGERQARVAHELAALGLIALAAYTLVSLVSHNAGRNPNLGGALGSALAELLESVLGFSAYVLALLVACLGRPVWAGTPMRELARESIGGLILLLSLSVAAGFCTIPGTLPGGIIGAAIAGALHAWLNFTGSYLLVFLATVCALALIAGRAPAELAAIIIQKVRARVSCRPANQFSGRAGEETGQFDSRANPFASPYVLSTPEPVISSPRVIENTTSLAAQSSHRRTTKTDSQYKLPPLELLDETPIEHARFDEAALHQSAGVLEQKLAAFGVQGQVVEVQPGPVVTMYKVEPGEGVKVSQIVNLADDLSMALRAASVRILAPVPGEAVVGIEVPNRKREKVYLREILEAEEFKLSSSWLAIALGKDIAGRPVSADLAAMPHLLIAGATGTGKSVSLHTMVASILFKATADDVRFILIDPKMLELSVYEGIPHLLVPVVVDPEKAAAALLWATGEMESRYRMMRELGVRNIDSYNRAIGQGGELLELKRGTLTENAGDNGDWVDTPVKHRRLPKIVIVIDELADLLLSEGKNVERDITRLAQKARAAGIHLILATQRPSVDVITGLIKANLPARISLQVTSRVDSRTILDSIGAERLLGAGDMLFMPPGTAKLRRLHGPFVSENEIRKVCDFLRAQGSPDYQMEILETNGTSDDDGSRGADEHDELYDQALQIVLESGQASISMIQRRLRIGYNRSARMVEQMEREGIVMPADGARPREVRIRGAS